MKALIVYATRYGATAGTSEEIAKVLREEGLDVEIVNAKEKTINDISEYGLIVVGGGMQMTRWTGETEDFLKKFQKELVQKKVALFVSSAMKSVYEREGKKEELEKLKVFLEDKAAKYALHPIALGLFGGILDYDKMGFIFRRALVSLKARFEAAGFKESKPGLIDTRDWDEIRNWARQLALKSRWL